MPQPGLYIGAQVVAGERGDTRVEIDPADLTTHGVIVGMTGSGKTGLATVLVEECLQAGIPALLIDPKGDLANLALRFPAMRAEDLRPWVDETEARRAGTTADGLAATTAATWSEGLASWGLDEPARRAYAASSDVTVYTPGSTAGVPLSAIGSLAPPPLSWDTEAETLRDEITGFVSGLLGMAGVTGLTGLTEGEILLATIVETFWRQGRPLDLPALVASVEQPPFRKLGVFEVDKFMPPADRTQLAITLNRVLASPSFGAWLEGPPIDPQRLLFRDDGRPRCAVISVAHLNDDERMAVVTLVLSKVVTWMRGQSGTSELRALVYMDEVAGYAPPTAVPPSKRPILTLLKQARAFGVGTVLATQNPVDLDYKAISNAGTWLIGRLQTERDKARLLDGLQAAAGGVDVAALADQISGLAKRRFVLHQTGGAAPRVLETRWAMSFLRGPLTLDQIASLMANAPERTASAATEAPAPAPASAPSAEPVPRAGARADALASVEVADGVAQSWLDPAAPWAAEVGAVAGGTTFAPGLAARCHLRFDDAKAGLHEVVEWEAVWFPLDDAFDPAAARAVDYNERDLLPDPPPGALYLPTDAPIDKKTFFTKAQSGLKAHLVRTMTTTLMANKKLKLYSRPDESADAFDARCRAVAAERADIEIAKLTSRFRARLEREQQQLRTAELRLQEAEAAAATRRNSELLSGAGALLGTLLGSGRGRARRAARSVGGAASRRGQTERSQQRVATLAAKIVDEQADLADVTAELEDTVADVSAEWDDVAAGIDDVEVRLSAGDVTVDDVRLLWVPIA